MFIEVYDINIKAHRLVNTDYVVSAEGNDHRSYLCMASEQVDNVLADMSYGALKELLQGEVKPIAYRDEDRIVVDVEAILNALSSDLIVVNRHGKQIDFSIIE